jgi:general secretion pathway protein G
MRIGSSVVDSSVLGAKGWGPLFFVLRHWPGARDKRRGTKDNRALGFTLLELMVVLTLILILASFAFPTYRVAVVRAREAVLRDDLYTMRSLIDQFTLDKQRPPQSLDELVDAGYLRGGVPVDPFTQSNQTWQVDFEDVAVPGSGQGVPGIVDVHSGSEEISLDGTPYSTW